MPSVRRVFEIEHVNSFKIGCSFCGNNVRQDVPNYDSSDSRAKTKEVQTKQDCSAQASAEGWKSMGTNHGALLNLCPDHAYLIEEIEGK